MELSPYWHWGVGSLPTSRTHYVRATGERVSCSGTSAAWRVLQLKRRMRVWSLTQGEGAWFTHLPGRGPTLVPLLLGRLRAGTRERVPGTP